MAHVDSFEQDILARLREELREQLHTEGSVRVQMELTSVTENQWRSAARDAAKDLGHRAVTTTIGSDLHASLTDWSATQSGQSVQRGPILRASNSRDA